MEITGYMKAGSRDAGAVNVLEFRINTWRPGRGLTVSALRQGMDIESEHEVSRPHDDFELWVA